MPEETANTTTITTSEAPPTETAPTEPAEPIKPALFDEPEDTDQSPPDDTEPQTETTEEYTDLTEKDITLPEGATYDTEAGNSFLGIINKYRIPKEAMQELADLYYSRQVMTLEGVKAAEAERVKKFEADMAAEKAEWLKQCQADPEYGGQKWEASQAVIDRGCKAIATPEAVSLMQRYNLNTHPEIVRMFYKCGKLAGEDNSQALGNTTAKANNPAMAIFGESLKDYHKRRGDIN